MKSAKEIFGANVRAYRKRLKMTQEDLASYLRTDKGMISRYESGQVEPSVEKLIKIADRLGASLDWLCGRMAADDQSARLMELVVERIAEALRRQGQFDSLAGVARMMGFDESRWMAIGEGAIVPTLHEILMIGEGLGAPLDWLLGHRNTWEERAPAPSLHDDTMRLFSEMHHQMGPERVDSLLQSLPEPARTTLGQHWAMMKRVMKPSERRAQRLKAVGETPLPLSDPIPLRAEAPHLPAKGGEKVDDDALQRVQRELARTQATLGALIESLRRQRRFIPPEDWRDLVNDGLAFAAEQLGRTVEELAGDVEGFPWELPAPPVDWPREP